MVLDFIASLEGFIAQCWRLIKSQWQLVEDYRRPPSKEYLEARELGKQEAKKQNLSRILIQSERTSERLPGIADASLDSGSAFFAAFASHALHAAIPVSRAGLISKGRTSRIEPPRSTTDKATVNFHSCPDYRVQFSGLQIWGNGIRSLDDAKQIKDIADKVFRDLIRPYSGNRTNETTIITGGIGCGKSTILTNLLYTINIHQARQTERRTPQTLPVEVALISFDDLDFTKSLDTARFLDDLVKPRIIEQVNKQTNLEGRTFEDVFGQDRTQNVVLIFDDLDAVYRVCCRDLILTQDNVDTRQGVEQFFPFVYELFRAFSSGDFSQYGIRCVFAVRSDTLRMLKGSRGPIIGGTSIIGELRGIYNLGAISGIQLVELFKRRLSLAAFVEDDADRMAVVKQRMEELEDINPDIDFVSNLSVQGLRHTLNLIQHLDWCLESSQSFSRFFGKRTLLTQLFLVGGYRHYSQINQGVTNIFLVNSSYRKENNPPLIDGKPAFSDQYLKPHKQTYFLKYLILSLIKQSSTDRQDIVDVFSLQGAYETELIELVIFSLCEVAHGRLIRPSLDFPEDGQLKINGLSVTPRGKYFLDHDVFWSFSYLAMVSEDRWLEVPNKLHEHFDNPKGALFLGKVEDSEFGPLYSAFLKEKAESVPVFLHLLEEAFECEKAAYHATFRTLTGRKLKFPCFDNARTECRKQLVKLLDFFSQTEADRILAIYDHWNSPKMRRKVRRIASKSLIGCH